QTTPDLKHMFSPTTSPMSSVRSGRRVDRASVSREGQIIVRITNRLRRMLLPVGLGIGAAALGLTGLALVSADGGTVDVQVANSTLCKSGTSNDGAKIFYEGKDCVDYGSSGTGVFNSFVRVQANPQESGYNTDGTLEFNTSGGTWT